MWVVLWDLLLRLPWRTWVCPCEGQVWRWYSCLGHRGSDSSRYSGELVTRAAGNKVLHKGMVTHIGQYTPVFLPGREVWQATVYRVIKSWTYRSNPACTDAGFCLFIFFCLCSSAPVRVEREGGTAAWLAGTLGVPSVQGHRRAQRQELWPYQSFF